VNFAYYDLNKIVYADLAKVSVAMDDGEILGYDGRGYLVNHHKRDYPDSLISLTRAESEVSPRLEILSSQLALIPTDGLEEKLCYEFRCQSEKGRNVLVYINAQTAEEEKILILIESDSGTLTE
jgi:germination protein YpeB